MAGENKAFPGLMEVLQDLKHQIKRSSLLYKIGNLTNISKISLQTQWLLLGEAEKKAKKKKKQKKNCQSPSSGDKCFLHLIFVVKKKTKSKPVFHLTVPSL